MTTARALRIHRLFAVISPLFRTERMRRFEAEIRPRPSDVLLDIGGTFGAWCQHVPPVRAIHVLNVRRRSFEGAASSLLAGIQGDARALPCADGAYDIAFSNSVIEHLGTWENQQRFAAEARRAARRLWIQTPAREFPIEPHYLTPFVHYLPRPWQRRLLRYASVWGWMTRPTPAEVSEMVSEIRLLTRAEMQALFPDCRILCESVLGLTKSYIAVR